MPPPRPMTTTPRALSSDVQLVNPERESSKITKRKLSRDITYHQTHNSTTATFPHSSSLSYHDDLIRMRCLVWPIQREQANEVMRGRRSSHRAYRSHRAVITGVSPSSMALQIFAVLLLASSACISGEQLLQPKKEELPGPAQDGLPGIGSGFNNTGPTLPPNAVSSSQVVANLDCYCDFFLFIIHLHRSRDCPFPHAWKMSYWHSMAQSSSANPYVSWHYCLGTMCVINLCAHFSP